MNQLEGRVGKVEEKLQLLVNWAAQSNEILLKLLEVQNSNTNDNKKGENDGSLRKPQDNQSIEIQAQIADPSNPNSEAVVKPPNRKRISTQTERHEERKRQRKTVEERKREREATMALEKKDQERKLAVFKASTKEITEAAQAGNLKEVIEKSKQLVSTEVTEDETKGRDAATLKLIVWYPGFLNIYYVNFTNNFFVLFFCNCYAI